jgi:phosphate/phosphite/phosphonate ABC transporter binding protein
MEIPDQLNDLKAEPAGDVAGKIGLLNPIGYALAHNDVPNVRAIAVVQRKIGTEVGPTYRAQLYTRRDSGINQLSQVRARSVAFGSSQSTSNFLVPAMMLWRNGIHPLNGCTRVQFAGGHPQAALAVYKREADVGAGHDGVITDLASRPAFADAELVLKRIEFSDPIPSDPVAIHTLDPRLHDQVAQALVRVAGPGDPNSEGNQAVQRFWGTKEGFIRLDDLDSYAPLLNLMAQLGLRPDDMLRM